MIQDLTDGYWLLMKPIFLLFVCESAEHLLGFIVVT